MSHYHTVTFKPLTVEGYKEGNFVSPPLDFARFKTAILAVGMFADVVDDYAEDLIKYYGDDIHTIALKIDVTKEQLKELEECCQYFAVDDDLPD